jgi:hypothetical protein
MLRKVVTLQACEISLLPIYLHGHELLLGWVLLSTMIVECQSPLHQSTRLTSQLMYEHNDHLTPILF